MKLTRKISVIGVITTVMVKEDYMVREERMNDLVAFT